MNAIDLPAIRQRADAATPAPWKADRWTPGPPHPNPAIVVAECLSFGVAWCYGNNAGSNAAFAAAARQDVPALCDEVERLRELVRRAYLEGFRDGEQAERTMNPDADHVWWNKSSSKKEV